MSLNLTSDSDEGYFQPLGNLIAQVRKSDETTIAGTAFAVDYEKALLVTCRHVVEEASDRCEEGVQVWIYFPYLPGPEDKNKLFRANVYRYFTETEDDIVLLQLENPPLPSNVAVGIIGDATRSVGRNTVHDFRSYGFRKRDKYQGNPASGTIIDFAMVSDGRTFHGRPVMLESKHIDEGMSGAPVLDLKRNVIVGVVAEIWNAENQSSDRDTSWAVDAHILSIAPLNLKLHAPERLPYKPVPFAPQNIRDEARSFYTDTNKKTVMSRVPIYFPAPPAVLTEWVGRSKLLQELDSDWLDPMRRVIGLIGIGGEGKTSLVFRWLSKLLADSNLPHPDGVFWWDFYANNSIEAMIEALTLYLWGKEMMTLMPQNSSARIDLIRALLPISKQRFLLVLDGLEELQNERSDHRGRLQSTDLHRLIESFGVSGHESHCVITSRIPLVGFEHTVYRERDVDRLTTSEGRAFLREVGVYGEDTILNRVVDDWDGHALTLSVLSAFLIDIYQGNASYYDASVFAGEELPTWGTTERRYARLKRILARYDKHLNTAERAFLKLMSVFRVPIKKDAFATIFRGELDIAKLNAKLRTTWPEREWIYGGEWDIADLTTPFRTMDDAAFANLLLRLTDNRLLRQLSDGSTILYSTHPLVRDYYRQQLAETPEILRNVHDYVGAYYISSGANSFYESLHEFNPVISVNPTLLKRPPMLADLAPYIEAIHHMCQAGNYNEADDVRYYKIQEGERFVLSDILCAEETYLSILQEFFPNNNLQNAPQVTHPGAKAQIIHSVASALFNLGRLADAQSFFARSIRIDVDNGFWSSASIGWSQVALVHYHLGDLDFSIEALDRALNIGRKEADPLKKRKREATLYATSAYYIYLKGDISYASRNFYMGQMLYPARFQGDIIYCGKHGIQYGEFLRRTDKLDDAYNLTQTNLEICEDAHWTDWTSSCHRLLGELEADKGNQVAAQKHFDLAVKIGRGVSQHRDVFIEALSARGRWAANQGSIDIAKDDLYEALRYTIQGNYRIYQVDIQIALAWMYLHSANRDSAKEQASRALRDANAMGYFWGKLDAETVLKKTDSTDSAQMTVH